VLSGKLAHGNDEIIFINPGKIILNIITNAKITIKSNIAG